VKVNVLVGRVVVNVSPMDQLYELPLDIVPTFPDDIHTDGVICWAITISGNTHASVIIKNAEFANKLFLMAFVVWVTG
jgi:hypothetical protein